MSIRAMTRRCVHYRRTYSWNPAVGYCPSCLKQQKAALPEDHLKGVVPKTDRRLVRINGKNTRR